MNEQFQSLPIDGPRANAAYPLVYLHDASITTGQWLRFVRRRSRVGSGQSGLIAIRDCRGIVHAMFSYRVDIDLRTQKRLCIADLIVAHLPGSRIEDAVLASAQEVSAQFDCRTICIERPFPPADRALRGCPTAELLQGGRYRPIATRRH